MDLKLSTAVCYGLTAINYINLQGAGKKVMTSEVCTKTDLPYDSTMKVLRQLCKAQLLAAHRGVKGGFSLRKTLDNVSLLDIIIAVDGPIEVTDISSITGDRGRTLNAIEDLIKQEKDGLVKRLNSFSLKELLKK